MNPLLRHIAPRVIHANDALRIANGGTWKDLWIRTCMPGGGGGGVRYTSTSRAITVQDSPDGPGQVTWAEIADLIADGLTPEIIAALEAACADWGTFNHDPVNRGDLTYRSCTDEFRRLEHLIIANALDDAATGQLALFDLAATC